jgi:ferrous iron transport protein A
MFLSDAPAGASFKVRRVTLEKEVGKRLADMGFTQDAEGAVVRRGFFNGPLQVRLRGYDILIRRFEATGIEVEPVGDWSAAEDATSHWGRFMARHGGGRRPESGGLGLGHGEKTRKEKKSWKPNCCE